MQRQQAQHWILRQQAQHWILRQQAQDWMQRQQADISIDLPIRIDVTLLSLSYKRTNKISNS